MYKNQTISLVIPCFNEEEGIKKILTEAPDFLDEIIVVDNNSTDRTGEVAAGLGAKVVFEPKKGYGRAIWTGVLASCGDIVVIMDGDGTYPTKEIPVLIDCVVGNNLAAVWGNRFDRRFKKTMPFLNQFGNRILSVVFSVLTGRWIADSQSGMMAFRRGFLEEFNPESMSMAFSEEIKMAAVSGGFKWREVGINYLPRLGHSKLNMWRNGFSNLFFLFYKRFKNDFFQS
jgi:glycosyltransferase involved in cell wall biosynthesis